MSEHRVSLLVGCSRLSVTLMSFSQELPWSKRREPLGIWRKPLMVWPRHSWAGTTPREFRTEVSSLQIIGELDRKTHLLTADDI